MILINVGQYFGIYFSKFIRIKIRLDFLSLKTKILY